MQKNNYLLQKTKQNILNLYTQTKISKYDKHAMHFSLIWSFWYFALKILLSQVQRRCTCHYYKCIYIFCIKELIVLKSWIFAIIFSFSTYVLLVKTNPMFGKYLRISNIQFVSKYDYNFKSVTKVCNTYREFLQHPCVTSVYVFS